MKQPDLSDETKVRHDPVRTGSSVNALKQAFIDNLLYVQGRFPVVATSNDNYMALAYTIRDRLLERSAATLLTYFKEASRTVCYLSAEYLPGPFLGNNLLNLGLMDNVSEAMHQLGFRLEDLLEEEEEPGLGNGGLGRLAACYLDSLATLSIPAIGYGIRYEFGMFDQEVRDGRQVEVTDKWTRLGFPWEILRPEIVFSVKLGGRTETYRDANGHDRVRWVPNRVVKGLASDTPISGYANDTTNFLRLWKAKACESFDFEAFNVGDYYGAVEQKVESENITKVLYPNDEPPLGKKLRLEQQYFFVSCSLQDMIRIHLQTARSLVDFHEKYAVQLNDTHPAVAVAELMRLLVDEHGFGWEQAMEITKKTFAYTNHTLLPEALERWPVELFGSVLPRHLEIVYEINRRFLDEVRAQNDVDDDTIARLSLIDETGVRYVRMAHLATVGSHTVNGVSKLHSDLLKRTVMRDFHELWPERFTNVTNGVTPRRFVALANPGLAQLVSQHLEGEWVNDLDRLTQLEPLADDDGFQAKWRQVKLENKKSLAEVILARTGIEVDPDSLFDVQVKRIHEYKRQHLNLLHVITLYDEIKKNPSVELTPRTVIFGGKAAPGYFLAKLIIELINAVGRIVNNDPDVSERLKVVFLPDYNVKLSQRIFPATDLSEQISTAGKEASGTGNMKFAMNGALTIGTLDGANIEIRDEVGPENFFHFGLTASEVSELSARGYEPRRHYEEDAHLRDAIDKIAEGYFSGGDGRFRPLVETLLTQDQYFVLADYGSYLEQQEKVSQAYRDPAGWTRRSILNTARMGKFSSDRSIRDYCRDIWKVEPTPVKLSG
ncbi:MAG: glycogen/starch/alpha-glucan phosphorylase [Acidobacteriota bacterium]|nr:MAG: glycogen/starch/alpha-glucan phosphorylase [Acidobacteriota bacterium]